MSNHTKGPWNVRKPTGNTARTKHWKVDSPTQPIGEVWNDCEEANAHIFAAAPDLLAALKAIFSENLFYHRAGDEKVFRAANEAIAKAEGRA